MDMTFQSKLYDYRVKVEQDQDPMNPREEYDNASTMVCWHRRYNLGDKGANPHALEPDEFITYLARQCVSKNYPESLLAHNAQKIVEKHFAILPLYLYDHSGITMSYVPFSCPWDTGQVGYIFMHENVIHKKFSGDKEKALACLRSEVEDYDNFLTGNVYGYTLERRSVNWQSKFVSLPYTDDEGRTLKEWHLSDSAREEDESWELVDLCGGFTGHDPDKNGIAEAVQKDWYIEKDKETWEANAIGANI